MYTLLRSVFFSIKVGALLKVKGSRAGLVMETAV
jgi:hypothetical protein